MFPNIRLVRPSSAYHCCQFLPSTYEQAVPEYADFSDLTEKVFFPGDIEIGQFKNHSLHPVIWSDAGKMWPKILLHSAPCRSCKEHSLTLASTKTFTVVLF